MQGKCNCFKIGTKKVLKVVKEEDRLWNAGDIIHLER